MELNFRDQREKKYLEKFVRISGSIGSIYFDDLCHWMVIGWFVLITLPHTFKNNQSQGSAMKPCPLRRWSPAPILPPPIKMLQFFLLSKANKIWNLHQIGKTIFLNAYFCPLRIFFPRVQDSQNKEHFQNFLNRNGI